jgi:hypothetical protein
MVRSILKIENYPPQQASARQEYFHLCHSRGGLPSVALAKAGGNPVNLKY